MATPLNDPYRASDELKARLRFETESGHIWLDEQRMILLHADSMGELRRELIESLGRERARGLLTRIGYASGVRDAKWTPCAVFVMANLFGKTLTK